MQSRLPLLTVLALLAALPARAAEESRAGWTRGPATVDLGRSAQVAIADDQMFADGDATRALMKAMGNPVSGDEVGLVASRAEGRNWFLVFEYNAIGYVPDDEKDRIDADAILASISKGTEEMNASRKDMGVSGLHVVGWSEQPHYDPTTNNLEWAILARDDDGAEVVNHNIRLLGRRGLMSVTLVDEPANLAAARTEARAVLAGFSYKPGSRYAEFVSGDRMAQLGLTALVAGGAGATAAKLGLFATLGKFFAKAGKLIVVGVLALLALARRLFGVLFRREERVTLPSEPA